MKSVCFSRLKDRIRNRIANGEQYVGNGFDALAAPDIVDDRAARDVGGDIANGCATGCLPIFVAEMGVPMNDEIDIVLIDDAPKKGVAQHPVFQWRLITKR